MLTVEHRLRILASERSDHRGSLITLYVICQIWSSCGLSHRSIIEPSAVFAYRGYASLWNRRPADEPPDCAQFCALAGSKSLLFSGSPDHVRKCTKSLSQKGLNAIWRSGMIPHYLSSFSLGVRVVAGSNPATPTIQIFQQNQAVKSVINSESGPDYPTTVADFAGTLPLNLGSFGF